VQCSITAVWLNIHMYCILPLHVTCSLFTQRTVLTEDNWCSIVCRLKNPCCSLRKTVPQELDPVHTVPAHRGKHCSTNTAITICDHSRFTTPQLCWTSSIVWSTGHVHSRWNCPDIQTGHLNTTQKKTTSVMWCYRHFRFKSWYGPAIQVRNLNGLYVDRFCWL
jgi:hypothetical protein